MYVREAVLGDNAELQKLQEECPQGRTLIVSIVNTPDFFARAKAYDLYKIYVACEDDQIIGSAACAIRDAIWDGHPYRVGYEFQYFTSPDFRGKGVAKMLHQRIEDDLTGQGVILSYLLIMEGNLPARRLFESQGFKLHRTLVMAGLPIYKKIDMTSMGKIRPITSEDLVAVAELLNDTWQGCDMYYPVSAETLAQFINRTPAYSFENLILLEDQGEVLACLGFWDWSRTMRITIEAINFKMRMVGLLLGILRPLRPMPRTPRPGDILRQWMLTPIGFKSTAHLTVLLRYMNNRGLSRGINQIFCVCEKNHILLESFKGFIRIDTEMYLYTKPLRRCIAMSDRPVFIDGIDL